jgi:ubiquinone/menaquinone biosynthesis C-methylase UbiE
VVGVDASADQLRVARRRAGTVAAGLVQADGARLPFPAGACALVVSAFTHTDVEDFTSLAREARRVLEGMAVSSMSACIRALPAPWPTSRERMAPGLFIREDMRGRAGGPVARGRWRAD